MRHFRAFLLADGVVPLDLPRHAAADAADADDTDLAADTNAGILEWDLGPGPGSADSVLVHVRDADYDGIACEEGTQ